MRRILCALALMALAPAAWAQDETEPTAAPGSIAEGMIEGADAQGVFEIVHNGHVSVRHVGSGMRCDFLRDGSDGRLVLFPGLPRGDNVACDSHQGSAIVTFYATRFPFETTLDEQLRAAEAAIRQVSPDAAAYQGPEQEIASDTLPPHGSAQFIVTRNGQRLYTRAAIALVGAWTIKLRYTAPAADDAAAAAAAETSWRMFVAKLDEMTAPPAP
ncbi:MAG: hypothetical protein AB7Q23_17575 [Hyphomonadaceae bacterium]